jgi:hypothetical protein
VVWAPEGDSDLGTVPDFHPTARAQIDGFGFPRGPGDAAFHLVEGVGVEEGLGPGPELGLLMGKGAP